MSEEAPRLKHKYGRINKELGLKFATMAPENDGPAYMVNHVAPSSLP